MECLELMRDALKRLDRKFGCGELAYLALTSKCEHAVRDRLAFDLHLALGEDLRVAREAYSRVDLAVLDSANGQPKCMMELKMGWSCDAVNSTRKDCLRPALEKDAAKLAAFKEMHPNLVPLQLLMLARPSNPPEVSQQDYIGYVRQLRQDHVPNGEELVKAVRNRYALEPTGVWSGGEAFGIAVDVHYWLFDAGNVGRTQ